MNSFVVKKVRKHTTPYYLSYPNEKWELINEERSYYISNFGRVYSINKDKIISTFVQNSGYVSVTLHTKGHKRNYTIHRLVARYFIPNPNNYSDVDHIDNNKFNNCVDNLQWCTHRYNSCKRDNSYILLYDENKNEIGLFYSAPDLSENINVSKDIIKHKIAKNVKGAFIPITDKINNINYYIKKL